MRKASDYFASIRKYETIIAASLVIFMVFFLSLNLLLPNLDRANQIFAQSKELEKKLKNLKEKDNRLTSLNQGYYKELFLKLNQVMPESKDYVSLFATFDILERQSGIRLLKTDFQLGVVSTGSASLARAPGTNAYMIPLSIEIIGSGSTIKNFLSQIADFNGRYMTFDDIAYTDKQTGSLQMTLNGRAYFYSLPATLGAVDTPLPVVDKETEAIMAKIDKLTVPTEAGVELDEASVGKKNLFQ